MLLFPCHLVSVLTWCARTQMYIYVYPYLCSGAVHAYMYLFTVLTVHSAPCPSEMATQQLPFMLLHSREGECHLQVTSSLMGLLVPHGPCSNHCSPCKRPHRSELDETCSLLPAWDVMHRTNYLSLPPPKSKFIFFPAASASGKPR